MSVSENICRLCMNEDAGTDLFTIDGDTTIDRKITACIDLKISYGDGLPAVICKMCENMIKSFYNFKQHCLLVDSKLRTALVEKKSLYLPNNLSLDTSSLDNIKVNVKIECENFFKEEEKEEYENSTKMKNSFDSWLSDDDSNFYTDYYNTDVPVKVEKIENPSEQSNEAESLQCNDKKVSNKKQHRKYTKNKFPVPKIFQCEICGRILKNKSVLIQHILTHSGVKQFSCNVCSKSFTREAHKTIHMRIHSGIKPYICEVCGRSFTKNQDLLRHMRVHSDVKNYACPRCDRKFKRSGDVHTHMRTHTGAKPYHCNTCDKSYTSHSGLTKHYKAHCKKEANKIK